MNSFDTATQLAAGNNLADEGVEQTSAAPQGGVTSEAPLDAELDNVIPTGTDEKDIQADEEQDINILSEIGSTVGGGAVDAIESVGGFAELTGDTIKTGFNSLFGNPTDTTQNPFDEDYIHGDGNWLNIPDTITDSKGNVLWEDTMPKTAIGRFGRGLVEFGLLTWATAGVGGATLGGARIGARGIAAARSMGVGAKGSRYLNLTRKGVKIGSEGAIADLISSSSEHANIMNLAKENIPWAVPIIGDMIAVKPEDNPWTARFKSIMAGAGLNYVGHAIGAIYKGFWSAGRARMAGKSADEANIIGNQAAADDFDTNMRLDEEAHVDMAIDQFEQGNGLSRTEPLDDYMRSYLDETEYDEWLTKRASTLDEDAVRTNDLEAQAQARGNEAGDIWDEEAQSGSRRSLEDEERGLNPFVNDESFTQTERATYRTPDNAVRQNLAESIESRKAGGDGSSYTPIISESYLKAISRGDANIRQYVNEVADDITDAAFKSIDNRLPWKEVKTTILRQANDLLEILEGGGDVGKAFRESMTDPNSNAYRLYADGPGNEVITISPTQKAANVLVMQALGKQVQGIATGTLSIADDVPIGRQADMIFDSMKVLLEENKKMGMMWGLDGKAQQQYVLSPTLERMKKRSMEVISQENDEYFNALRGLIKQERWDELSDLIELHELSGGKVRTLVHINEYLRSIIRGGRMDDVHIKGRVRKELQGTFFNSVLSSFATPIKAIGGTNMLAVLRPMQAWLGAGIRGKNREMFMAASQLDNMSKAWAESLQMAKYNWDLGVQRKGQTYQGKFDFDADMKEWKQLKPYYERYGSPREQIAYGALDKIVDINSSPWVKYSVNAMGAGDAAARTIIGRQYMRQKAAAAAWDAADPNVRWTDKDILKKIAQDGDEKFRDEIFKKDKNGMFVVSHKGASMAGDEAAMTRGLQENFKGFELISNIPGMKAFFPFVRTGFNYLDVTFQHTPLQLFRDKYHDIKNLAESPNPSKALLHKYGIKPDEALYELAIMEGRMAMGTSVIGLATWAALSGKMTGDMPVDKRDRDLWKLNGIQPKSFKVADNTYVSYEKLEIFNTLFSTTANVVGNANLLGEDKTDEWMKKLTFMTAAVVVDQSMLAGVEDLARLMNPQTSEDLLLQSGSRYLRSHLPYSGLMAQIGDIADSNQKEANTFLELISKRDVLFKQNVPNKYDVLNKNREAQPLRYGPDQPLWRLWNSMSLVAITNSDADTVKQGLETIRFNMPETLGTYRGEPLNSSEQSQIEEILAQKNEWGDLRQDLVKVMNHPAFKKTLADYQNLKLKESDGYKLNDQIFYSAIRKVFSYHKAQAVKKLMMTNPQFALRVEARLLQKQAAKTGTLSPKVLDQVDQLKSEDTVNFLLNQFPK